MDGKFFIAFTDEIYFELLDFISDFTGIEQEMMNVVVEEVVHAWIMPEITDQDLIDAMLQAEYEDIERLDARNVTLSMGTEIWYFDWRTNNFHTMGTLGHPRDSAGRTAFGASHGVVPINALVHISEGSRIGVVSNPVLVPSMGIDVSYIRLDPGFTMSTRIPATGLTMTNFFANVPNPPTSLVTLNTRSGNRIGPISAVSVDVVVNYGGSIGMVTMHNVIRTDIPGFPGDSGSALTMGNNAIGTMFAGGPTGTFSGRAPAYQFVR